MSLRKSVNHCAFCEKCSVISGFTNNVSLRFLEVEQEEACLDSPSSIKIIRNFTTNKREIIKAMDPELELLKIAIDTLKRKYHKTTEEIIEICEKVSGSIRDVEEYLNSDEDQRKFLIWTPEDDEVLALAKSADDYIFKVLLRYKGPQKIKSRLVFKSLALPFQL